MAPYGFRTRLLPAGPRITTDIGLGWNRGAGLGLTMRLGDSLRSTTGAGRTSAIGPGSLDRLRSARFTHPRSSRGSADPISTYPFRLAAELELPGSRWDRGKCTCPRIMPARPTSIV